MLGSEDVVSHVEDRLADARAEAADAYGRVDALTELRGLLLDFCGRRGETTLTIQAMYAEPRDTEEDARLGSLINRALGGNDG